jgi:hypothetical protein
VTKKREFNSRWGNAIADDYQYCHVPGYILRNYSKCVSVIDVLNDSGEIETKRGQIVDLDMQDMMFVIHVMAFKYDAPNGKASPGLPTIAEYTGLHVTSVRRIKQKLISYGLLTIESTIGRPDVYTFAGLHDQCVRLEQELEPIEGVPVTPSKSASGSKNARGWASKSARGTPSKSATRRVKGNLEEKKEKKEIAASPFIEMKNAIQKAFEWDKPTDTEWGQINKSASQLIKVDIVPDDIASLHGFCKVEAKGNSFTPLFLASKASTWKKQRPARVIPETPIEKPSPAPDGDELTVRDRREEMEALTHATAEKLGRKKVAA